VAPDEVGYGLGRERRCGGDDECGCTGEDSHHRPTLAAIIHVRGVLSASSLITRRVELGASEGNLG